MENPFVYGEVVPDAAFVDREEELQRLAADLAAGQKVFLISPRRYGKSSLIRRALAGLRRQRLLTATLTVSSFSSYVAFLEGYVQALAEADRAEPVCARGSGFLPGARRGPLRGEPDRPGARLSVAFPAVRHARDVARLAEEVFALPGRLRRRAAVAWWWPSTSSRRWPGSTAAAWSRRCGRRHSTSGSRLRVRRFGAVADGADDRAATAVLQGRPRHAPGTHPRCRLRRVRRAGVHGDGLRPEPGLGGAVVELAGNLPYDVQRLAHETWDDARAAGRRIVTLDDLHGTLRRLLAEHHVFFEHVWQRLTLAQRGVLRAVVLNEGREMLAADTREHHRWEARRASRPRWARSCAPR